MGIVNVVTIISMPARFKTDTRKIIYAALNKVMDRPRLAPTRTSNQTFLHRDFSQTHEDYQYINDDKNADEYSDEYEYEYEDNQDDGPEYNSGDYYYDYSDQDYKKDSNEYYYYYNENDNDNGENYEENEENDNENNNYYYYDDQNEN